MHDCSFPKTLSEVQVLKALYLIIEKFKKCYADFFKLLLRNGWLLVMLWAWKINQ